MYGLFVRWAGKRELQGTLKGQRHDVMLYWMFVRWAGRKRDIVDEVLVRELEGNEARDSLFR